MRRQDQKPILVIGAGGHAKVVANVLHLLQKEVLGFTSEETRDKVRPDNMVLGGDSIVDQYSPDQIQLANGIGAVPGKNTRWKVAFEFRERGFDFVSVVHPSAIIAEDAIIETGVQLMAGCIVQPGCKIGKDCILNTGAIVDHDCIIEENCHLAPSVTLCGGVSVLHDTFVGAGSTIQNGIIIGKHCTIAAGSLVFENINNHSKLIQKK